MERTRLSPETLTNMASFKMLTGLSPAQIGIMASVMTEIDIPKDTYFIFEDSNDLEVFFILKGQAEIRVPRNSGGGNGRLAVVGPGETVGEFALARTGRRSASSLAVTDVVALKTSSEELHQLFSDHPSIGYFIYRNLLRLTVERLEDTNFLARKVV